MSMPQINEKPKQTPQQTNKQTPDQTNTSQRSTKPDLIKCSSMVPLCVSKTRGSQ